MQPQNIDIATVQKVNICGTDISNVSLSETMQIFEHWIQTNQKKRVCVTPVNCVVWAADNPVLQAIYNTADLTLCDGVPLLWAAKFLGTPLKGRVTGLDLLPAFTARCAEKNYSLFLLGAKPGVGEALAKQMLQQYPGLNICGIYSPPMAEQFSTEENNHMLRLVEQANPDILWVSLSAPKQDYWIAEHLAKIQAKIVIGVGGAFEVSANLIPRAPGWMQKAGLEWLYRFIQEPRRLFFRYFIEAPKFLPILLKQRISG